MATISGCMICYNEKEMIRVSVLNLLRFVDEIIICDGNSTDGTLDILHDLEHEYPQIKLKIYKQSTFRERSIYNSHQYYTGFDEIPRRNYALSQCNCDYILMKDVDELYEDNFYDIIKRNPEYNAFCHVQYEVINNTQFFTDVRLSVKHKVSRFIQNSGNIQFINSPNMEHGIDCYLSINGVPVSSSSKTMVGAFDMWHYKQVANKILHNIYIKRGRKGIQLLPKVSNDHKKMMESLSNLNPNPNIDISPERNFLMGNEIRSWVR